MQISYVAGGTQSGRIIMAASSRINKNLIINFLLTAASVYACIQKLEAVVFLHGFHWKNSSSMSGLRDIQLQILFVFRMIKLKGE